MNNLPFNKWTLGFINKQYEDLYETEMNKYRQSYFRIIEVIILILCILFFIFSLLEGRQIIISVILAVSSIAIFLALIYGQRFASKVRYYYFLMYVTSLATSLYVASQTIQKSPFLYGYSSATIAIIQFLFSHFKLRLFTLLIVPIVQLYILDVLTLEDFGYIVLVFMTQLLIVLYSHYNEFMFRLAFSYMLYNLKLKDISEEYIPHSFLALSLNVRNNQFQLEFQNQIGRTNLNVEDSKTLIEMMRNTYVVPKGQIPTSVDLQNINIQRSGDLSMRRLTKKQTLEEFAFYKIKQNLSVDEQQSKDEAEEMEGVFYNQVKEKNVIVSIDIKNLSFGKNYLLLVVKEEKQPQMMSKSEEQIRFLSKIIQFASNQLSASHQHLYKEITGLKLGQIDNNKIWQIKCINLSIMSHYQNFYFFVNYTQINNFLAAYNQINLKYFLINLQQHFSYMCMKMKKQFLYELKLDDFMIKVNSKFLSQIVFNIFEQCLKQSDSNSTINLSVKSELNLNPLQNNIVEKKCLQELDFIEKVAEESQESPTKIEFQKLVKFEFTFLSSTQVELQQETSLILNPQTYEDYHFNNNQEFQLNHPITNFLLKKIGPYNSIQYSQNVYCDHQCQQAVIVFPSMMDLIQQQTLYQNKISFYIYSDQTQLTQSFIKYAQQKSFLQP
ncbi:unnamed protein product (macronuclear) [Paramecium tetraurelia]|uniref:Transmembrane protein n=1 Tax=Paramecium tetraurelia TaxID=5888 RepID=A0DQH9_PARTE|nr:uncharacterized protein GSPATT00002696001 [Paramecium tetraurelia]CAK85296.1 unnamed protein product [Paramecium tetraurelia]|eukprot:XP_001452693.1 hypothetical protein (macronuclear) [Paramecium tetraurelia strain d4-2]